MTHPNKYASDVLDYFYEEGDRDLIYFGDIIGEVSYDANDVKFAKTDEQRFMDACRLVRYLTDSHDFDVGTNLELHGEVMEYVPFIGGYEEFFAIASRLFSEKGIDDMELDFAGWLRKKKKGKPAPPATDDIAKLFG